MLRSVIVVCILVLNSSVSYCDHNNGDLEDNILTVRGESTQSHPNGEPAERDVSCHVTGSKPLKDCSQLLEVGVPSSGVYLIQPVTYAEPFYVYCDMETDGGGWTIFQRRLDGSVWFYRGWEDYKTGFGNINSEYWLGNEKLFYLTAQGDYELRVDLEDFEGEKRYALYDKFRIGDEGTFYKLMLGNYSGTAGDSLGFHNGSGFITKDFGDDPRNCVQNYKGGWWYGRQLACHSSNLNGIYHGGEHESFADGVNWRNWRGHHYSLKASEMKTRRQ